MTDTKKLKATIAAKKQEVALKPPTNGGLVADSRPQWERTLDELSPSWAAGRVIKFSHETGVFRTTDDEQEVSPDLEFAALCGETLIGFVRFNGKGEMPDRIMGKVFSDFTLPARNSLGDTDKSTWQIDKWGQPEDPWQIHAYLVVQRTDTSEMFTVAAQNPTGVYAVGQLSKHYGRCCKDHGEAPLVHLRAGTYKGRAVPVFSVCGQRKLDPNAPSPPPADPVPSVSGDLDDELKF